jgi:hypothetical protein
VVAEVLFSSCEYPNTRARACAQEEATEREVVTGTRRLAMTLLCMLAVDPFPLPGRRSGLLHF